ncbi:MAG: hypothetical protein WBH03_02810 [Cyclobacteriaceae bacterium]
MKKQTKNSIKWIGLTTLLGSILWFAYDLHFKFVINDYQAKQIERRLQENFHKNRDDFDKLLIFSKVFHIELRENGQISFQVYDTSLDRKSIDNYINIDDSSIFDVKDIEFSDHNSTLVLSGEQTLTFDKWIIDFEGEMNNPIVEKLLSYNKISTEELKELKKNLEKINCSAFDRNDSLITIRYEGHWGESFNYLFPLTHKAENNNWNKLEDNYYWEYYQNALFCGWTDW